MFLSIQKFISKYFLETQLWVSFMIFLLSIFYSHLNNSFDLNRNFLVFFSTLGGYNFTQYHRFWKGGRFLLQRFLFLISSIICLFLLIEINMFSITFLFSFLGIFVFIYNSIFFKFKFREIKLLKIFVIAFVWTTMVLYVGNDFQFNSPAIFFSLFLFIVGITIPFDIADSAYDRIETIPIYFGIYKSKIFAILCLLFSYWLFSRDINHLINIIWLITCIISIFLILLTKKNSFFLTRFWMEGCSGIPCFIIIITEIAKK